MGKSNPEPAFQPVGIALNEADTCRKFVVRKLQDDDRVCHLPLNTPLLTCRQRAGRVKREQTSFFIGLPAK